MHHKKNGYILFLLFAMLSACMTLITLFFSKSIAYHQLTTIVTKQEEATDLAIGSISLGQSILYIPTEQSNEKQNKQATNQEKVLFEKTFPYLNQNKKYNLKQKDDLMDATIELSIASEHGKLNLNTLYNFDEKKFFYEGKPQDKKKLCEWLFKKIGNITKQPSLFEAFESYVTQRTTFFNDVTELLEIPEFAKIFQDKVCIHFDKNNEQNIYLTDIFTINTEQESINPWLFSHSWCTILELERKKLSEEDIKTFFTTFKKQVNWDKEWNSTVKQLYDKDYQELAQEIKSMLTTDFEANIFSLLLRAIIGETTATIFTIVKSKQENNGNIFDIAKIYQI